MAVVRSMTGFARTDGAVGGTRWAYEVRAVNGRALDLRLRLPPGYDGLEPAIRDAAQQRLARGTVTVTLTVDRGATGPVLRLDERALAQAVTIAERVRQLTGAGPPTVEGLLGVRGVLELVEPDATPAAEAARVTALIDGAVRALDDLVAARTTEGVALAGIVGRALDVVDGHVAEIAASPARRPEAIAARLAEQIDRLIGRQDVLDRDRLYQEAVLVATRADVEEEVQRLALHVATARALLAGGGAIGRKLELLVPELVREASTLSAKANHPDVARAGLAVKVAVDQIREQSANIE
jgi:uncharacterized protein (TIGR00255 family)